MRAVWMTGFGGPGVLEARETPDPAPEAGQVLIKVAASVVNFIDTLVRADRMPWPTGGPTPPFVPGNGVSGVVTKVGAQVDASLVGQRVISGTGGAGGYAELVVAPAAELIPVPAELSLIDAAALLADGRTAVGLAEAASLGSGDSALVLAAAGGVGSLLVQLGVASGARVIGAVGGADKVAFVRSLGAEAIDYTCVGWADGLRVDVLFDGVGGDAGATALRAMRPGGRYVQYGLSSGSPTVMTRDDVAHIGFDVLRAIGARSAELTRKALAMAASGRIRPTVGQAFSLEQAPAAHTAVESRATIGRTLLIPSGES